MNGIRRRLFAPPSESTSSASSTSPFTNDLAKMYVTGQLRANGVGKLASSAVLSGHHGDHHHLAAASAPKGLSAYSKRHNSRNSSQNLRRGISRLTGGKLFFEPYRSKVPMWNTKTRKPQEMICNILPPHEILERVVPLGEEKAWSNIDPTQQAGLMDDLKKWAARVGIDLPSHLLPLLAIALWGDSAPLGKRNGLYLLTLKMLSGKCKRRYWIFAASKRRICQCCGGRHTFDEVWRILAWSFRALLAGVWPALNHRGVAFSKRSWRGRKAGKPLRFGGACLGKCADWSWHKQMLNLQGWKAAKGTGKICWICEDSFTDGSCFNVSPSRKRKLATMSGFSSAAVAKGYLCPIFSIPGFCLSLCKPDWMHTIDLGIVMDVSGNIMWELLKELGGTYKRHLKECGQLLAMVHAKAAEMGVDPPFYALTITMIRSSMKDKPKMKLKAAESRWFVPILSEMLLDYFPCTTPRQKKRQLCIGYLAKTYVQLKNWDAASPWVLADCGRKHLQLYFSLKEGGLDKNCWHKYPKHHLALHCFETLTNPALEWNYMDESEIGTAVDIAAGVNEVNLHVNLIQRYCETFSFFD